MTELKPYLEYLCKSTNMKCLTPEKALDGIGDYMAANLYTRSIFGEDALANLSIEKPINKSEAPVTGHIRIRAKSQVCKLFFKMFLIKRGTSLINIENCVLFIFLNPLRSIKINLKCYFILILV